MGTMTLKEIVIEFIFYLFIYIKYIYLSFSVTLVNNIIQRIHIFFLPFF